MSFKDDLAAEVAKVLKEQWTERDGQVVPEPKDIKLGSNDAVKLEATVLYADLAASTALVEGKTWSFAGEVYKVFLHCCAKIIKKQGGVIVSYDGDRIMAIFIGNSKNTSAVKAGLLIKGAVLDVINPAIKRQYPKSAYTVSHGVGVDTGTVYAARTGVRDDNDIVWIGKAPNYAAKLCDKRVDTYHTWITEAVYKGMNDSEKYDSNKNNMWKSETWAAKNITIYKSSYYRHP